jgi:hypothetical protein
MGRVYFAAICVFLTACQPVPANPGVSPSPKTPIETFSAQPSSVTSPSPLPSMSPSSEVFPTATALPAPDATPQFPVIHPPQLLIKGQVGSQDGSLEQAKIALFELRTFDKEGSLFFDSFDGYIRKITPQGQVKTVLGTGVKGYKDGPGNQAQFKRITSCAVDQQGNIYLSDYSDFRVRKITSNGLVSTLAGTGIPGYADGPSEQASFQSVRSIILNEKKQRLLVYIDSISLREIDLSTNRVRTLHEQNSPKGDFTGFKDGPLSSPNLFENNSLELALDPISSVIYLIDYGNRAVRQIKDDIVSTLAGGSHDIWYQDGESNKAQFADPQNIVFDPERRLIFLTDKSGIRLVTPEGRVRTLALPGQKAKEGDSFFPTNSILNGSRFLYLKSKNELLIIPGYNPDYTFEALFYKVTLPDGTLPELKL